MKYLLSELDRSAIDASNRYDIFASSILNECRRGMIGPNALSAVQGKRMKKSIIEKARTFLEEAEARIEIEIDALSESALRAAIDHLGMSDVKIYEDALSDELTASQEASVSYLLGEMTSQVNRDVNQTIKDYRNACLRALMKTDATGMPAKDAKQAVLFEEMQADRGLSFTDKAGRKVSSHLHIRRSWRGSVRDHWIQVYLQTLAYLGETKAVVWHPDVTSAAFGSRIDITAPDFGLPNKSKIFHPNARAIPVTLKYMELTT